MKFTTATNEWQVIASLTVPRVCAKMVLIDATLYVLGGKVKGLYDLPNGMVPVECYDEERDIWNDRTAKPISRIPLEIWRATPNEYFLEICSLRLFEGVELSNLYPYGSDR